MDDFIATMTQRCQELTQKRDELARQAAQKGDSSSTELKQALGRLDVLATNARELLSSGPPKTAAEKEAYAQKLFAVAGEGGMVTRSVQRGLGVAPSSVLERRMDAGGLTTRFGRWDNQSSGNATAKDINISRHVGDNNFFAGSPQSRAPVSVGAEVRRTSEAEAREITRHDRHWGGGVMLEGAADALWQRPQVKYNSEFNALTLDDRAVYFLRIPPWTAGALARAVAVDENALVGVSLTGNRALLFGDPITYENTDLARDLMLADQFLGDIVFGRNLWTAGYKFPGGFHAQRSRASGDLAVRFAFNGYKFRIQDEEIRSTEARLEIRFAPLSAEKATGGGLIPDYQALGRGYQAPAEYVANAGHVTNNIDYYRREPIVQRTFDYGEVAALFRGLKKAGVDLTRLAYALDKFGGARTAATVAGRTDDERLENYWTEYLGKIQQQDGHPNWEHERPLDYYLKVKAEREQERSRNQTSSIQSALIWLGHYNGMVDNDIGAGTVKAIRAFQAENGYPATGQLTAEQTTKLFSLANRVKSNLKFTILADDRAELTIGVPLAYVSQKSTTERGYRLVGQDRELEIETLRITGADTLDDLFERISYQGPIKQITYARKTSDWIVVAGRDDSHQFYFMARQNGAQIKGFSVAYAVEKASIYERVTIAMANTFQPSLPRARSSANQ